MNESPERRIEGSLRTADGLLAAASALSIALEDFPAIDLPPSSGSAVDQAQVRAMAVLYLASEFEAASLLRAAEDLVRLARTGSLGIDLGTATPAIESFWQTRQERASAEERQSFFAALFGGDAGPDPTSRRNAEFEDRLLELCEALYKLDEQATNRSWGGPAQQAHVRAAADQLLQNLSRSSSGLTAFLAKEILGAIKQALTVLKHQAVLSAFGARSVAQVIQAIDRRFRRTESADFDLHIRRGQSGMVVLSWLAEAAPLLTAGQPIVALDHPVIAAAADWLETSLTLTESKTRNAPAPDTKPDSDASWAAIAR